MSNAHSIRNAAPGDAAAIAAIYNLHVRSTIVTFELEEVSDEAMSNRISDVQSHGLPWLVCVAGDEVLGYVYGRSVEGARRLRTHGGIIDLPAR